jgi:hypothetical protein
MRKLGSLALVALLASTAVVACSSTPKGSSGTRIDTTGGDDSGSGTDDSGFVTTPTGGDDGGISGFEVGTVPTKPTADAGIGDACAATHQSAKMSPVDIFIMQDQSGSMSDTTMDGTTKWDAVAKAISTFVADPTNAGTGLGVGYFGLPDAADPFGGDSCNASDYAKPDVAIATLPGVASAINASYAAHSPTSGTPTAAGLEGAIQYARTWKAAHADHVVVVLFATDGLPNECSPTDQTGLANIAKTAFTGSPSIPTYVIGVLAPGDVSMGQPVLDAISNAGNGAPAFIIKSMSDSVETAFTTALAKIRGSSLQCNYPVPTGSGVDYTKVNVAVTDSSGKSSIVPYVGSAAGCTTAGGWYYDVDPAKGTPKQILTCDATCTTLKATTIGTVDIQLGCQQVTMIPM